LFAHNVYSYINYKTAHHRWSCQPEAQLIYHTQLHKRTIFAQWQWPKTLRDTIDEKDNFCKCFCRFVRIRYNKIHLRRARARGQQVAHATWLIWTSNI